MDNKSSDEINPLIVVLLGISPDNYPVLVVRGGMGKLSNFFNYLRQGKSPMGWAVKNFDFFKFGYLLHMLIISLFRL